MVNALAVAELTVGAVALAPGEGNSRPGVEWELGSSVVSASFFEVAVDVVAGVPGAFRVDGGFDWLKPCCCKASSKLAGDSPSEGAFPEVFWDETVGMGRETSGR